MGIPPKKLTAFLLEAVEHKVITQKSADSLVKFSQSEHFKNESWGKISNILGGVAALTIVLGIILIVASNWHDIHDTVKLTGLLALMGGSHYAGLKLHKHCFEKLAITMHSIGCGLIYAGIGLVAQIFHLQGEFDGPLITYSILVAPMAILLRSELLSFSVFVSLFAATLYRLSDTAMILYYTPLLASSIFLILHASKITYMQWVKGICITVPFIATYLLGFAHDMHGSISRHIALNLPVASMLIITLIALGFAIKRGHKLAALSIAPVLALLTLMPIVSTIYGHSLDSLYDTTYQFGARNKIYIDNYVITLLAWISYFFMAGMLIYNGARQHINSAINIGIILLGIGIYTRFIDLVGSMLNLGQSFIVLGTSFLLMTYLLEKWRRNIVDTEKEAA
jgi:uncharacterized membrane protein